MSLSFDARKQSILDLLNTPDDQYTDASPKGSLDEGIRDLVNEINGFDKLVTTSSCAGRFVLYLEGQKKRQGTATPTLSAPEISDELDEDVRASAGGKGGGQWLFVSHEAVDNPIEGLHSFISADSGFSIGETMDSAAYPQGQPLLHCKFEPMVNDVLTD